MTDQLLLGIDIGGTKSAVILGSAAGEIIQRQEFRTKSPQDTIIELLERTRRICSGKSVAACGISCGGPLSSREGLILSPPNLPGWDRIPIVKRVLEILPVPTRLENDANAAALAEWRWGLERKIDDLVYLTCGTGMGAGIIIGGKLHRGGQDLAGEIGHVRLLPLGPVGYYKAGSVEGLTSGRALGELARLRLQEPHAPTPLDKLDLAKVDGKDVGDAAIADDAFATSLVAELGSYLGRACAILIDILNPQRISLGSMARRLGGLLLDPLRTAAATEALPAAYEACTIDASVLGDRAQDLAALAIAADEAGTQTGA